MTLRLRRWIALLALLLVSVTDSAAAPLCLSAESGAAVPEAAGRHHGHAADPGHPGHGAPRDDGERHGEGNGPASPACPLGMMAGSGGCLGGYLTASAPRAVCDVPARPAFAPPAPPCPRIAAVSLFRPPRA